VNNSSHDHRCWTVNWITYIYDNGDKSQQQQFEGNRTMSAVITSLWEPLTNCSTFTFITNSSETLLWLPTDFISSQQQVQVIRVHNNLTKILGKPIYKICMLGLCCISKSNRKTQSWCWLALKRHTYWYVVQAPYNKCQKTWNYCKSTWLWKFKKSSLKQTCRFSNWNL
jgi:hypothetical protein